MLGIAHWNFKQLQAFVLVAEYRSFKRAAQEAVRSQAAISAQIRQLETSLGTPLFERTTRRVSLTAEGEELYEFVRLGFAQFELGWSKAQRVGDRRSDRIRVACIPAVMLSIVPGVVERFRRQHPEVDLCMIEHLLDDTSRSVIDQDVHFGIGSAVPSPECSVEVVFEDEIVAVFPSGEFPSNKRSIPLVEILDYTLIRPTQVSPKALQLFETAARRHGKPLLTGHQVSHPQSIVAMVAAGQGVTCLSKTALATQQTTGVQVLKIVDPTPARGIAIIQNNQSTNSQAARDLIEIFREALSAHGEQISQLWAD